jgi:sigma-B regulation protein RsbU (phosphoserine phosphatase)
MLKNSGLALKLAFFILTSITLIFFLLFSYNYVFSRRIIENKIEQNAKNLARATVNQIDKILHPIERVPQNVAYLLEDVACSGHDIMKLLRSVVEENPDIYGAAIAFEPFTYSPDIKSFAPYFFKAQNKTQFTDIPYDYFYWDWYQIPKELQRPMWSEPYFDEGAGEIVMATYSVPFYRKAGDKREFIGVVTADISLTWLQNIVSSIKIGQTGHGFLLSKNGMFVTHPDANLIMNETIFSVAELRNDLQMRELGRKMIRGETGFAPFRSIVTGKECWMVYAPLSSSNWSLGVLFPRKELMTDITRLSRMVFFLSLAGFLFIMVVIIWIAGSITRPLRALSKVTEDIATGNLDVELPQITSTDEVGKLAGSIEYMKTSLKQYIHELTETTAAKERIEHELKIAHDIQMGILPKTFPPFPEKSEFDLYATLEPAKEVGGDLYDFFFMDDEHLCFAVGDVSDKGVPASLFMAITKTLIKTKATKGLTSDMVLTRVNEDLALDNPSVMFVTLFLGIFNIRTGVLEYCNGGHNPPYIIRANGDLEKLAMTQGMALGVMEDFIYTSKTLTLRKGETLFMYTDGVTEAINKDTELFSEKKLEKELDTLKEKPLEALIGGVMDKVKTFSHGMPQTDDIAMMALRYYGTKPQEAI